MRHEEYHLSNVRDTAFSERVMTGSRDIGAIYMRVEKVWIPRHGAPAAISVDHEYTKKTKGSKTGVKCPDYAQKTEKRRGLSTEYDSAQVYVNVKVKEGLEV